MADTELKSADFDQEIGNRNINTSTEEVLKVKESPPAYSLKNTNLPPSYASIFGQLKDAKLESSGNVDFAKKAVPIITCGGMCNIMTVFIMWVFAVVCIAVGAAYNNMCPAAPMIPKHMIVFGSFYTLKVLLTILKYFRRKCEEDPNEKELPVYFKAIDALLDCFLLIWFIVGNVYVYGLHGKYQSNYPAADDFCDRNLYLFAFWMITIQYILMILMCCFCCGFLVVFCFFLKKDGLPA